MVLDWVFLWNARFLCFIKVVIITQVIILNSCRSLGPGSSFPVKNQRQTKTKHTYLGLDTDSYMNMTFSNKGSTHSFALPLVYEPECSHLSFFNTHKANIKCRFYFQHRSWQNYPINNTNHINRAREAFPAVEDSGEGVFSVCVSIFPDSYIILEKILDYQA